MLGETDRRAGESQRVAEPARDARRRLTCCRRERILTLGEPFDDVVELLLEDRVASAGVRLRKHAHEVAGVVAAEISGTVFPTPHGLRAFRVEPRVGAEDREYAIRAGEYVLGAAVSARVGQHAVALLCEKALAELHLRQREGTNCPSGERAVDRLGDARRTGRSFEPR